MLDTKTVLQNRYHIRRPLGRGGMGAVYEAFDERLSRTVALKQTLVETDEWRRAFEREARLLANLRHPALPKVLDHFAEAAGLFLVMEFIQGDDLSVMLERGDSLTTAQVLRWGDQLLEALEYLHQLDPPVLHRDIKPSNLKLISPNQIVLLDFGLAKGRAGQMTRTANSHSVLGYSPNYSSLEQMQGTGTDERSDLYSLGATLYHLLTGVKPPDALTRATAVVNGQPDPLRPAQEFNQTVPASVSAALLRAMALNIDHRPPTASEMLDELHGMTARAASTVPMSDADETTKVNVPARRADVLETSAATMQERRGRMVVPVPEAMPVVQPRGRGLKLIGISLIAGLVIFSALVYLLFPGQDHRRGVQTASPVVNLTPHVPLPSPTPAENTVPQDQIDARSQPVEGPEQIAARAKLEQRDIPYNEEAFTAVVEKGDSDAVELFLAAGMNPNVMDTPGRSALINAASRGRDNISRKLLSRGAQVNARDNSGATALMEAARRDHRETTRVLLEHGADVNLRDQHGQTALLRAARSGHSQIVRLLINHGARIEIKDRDGRDALTWAEINNQRDVVELLKKAGAASR